MVERIDVVFTERGGRVVRRRIDEIGVAARGAQGAVQLLRRALGTLGVTLGVRELVRLVDTFTNLTNRLRIVTSSTAQLTAVTERLFQVAERTRSSFESTTELFARTALAVRDLGVSQAETLQFTESLNQAVILSGASAQEANAGIIQLSQGLASGTLRGDELRSVLEQLPAVSDVIAQSLGVTRGQLRELGQQGRITARVILDAFREARDELAQRFATTVPTLGQAFTVLGNSLTRIVGALSTSSGATEALARAIIVLANNLETVLRGAAALAITLGTVLAARAIPAVIAGINALTLALLRNPLTALAVAATTAISALISFGDQLRITATGAATVADVFAATFQEIRRGVVALADIVVETLNEIIAGFSRVTEPINLTFGDIVRGFAGAVDGILGLANGLFRAVVATFTQLPRALGDLFFQALNVVNSIVQDALNRLIGGINAITEFIGAGTVGPVDLRINTPLASSAREAGTTAAERFPDNYLHRNPKDAEAIMKKILLSEKERKEIAGIKKIATERARNNA